MEASIADLGEQVDEATAALLGTVATLSGDDLRQPALLPGWSCGQVLDHVIGTAEAFSDLLDGRPVGALPEPRAGRVVTELTAGLTASADRFRRTVARQPADGWDRPVQLPHAARPAPARQVLVRRLVEVELHHVDLGLAYRSENWPTRFNMLELSDPMRQWRADRLR